MDEQQVLAEAQELIEVRQYHNARRLLNTIPDNPTAQQLLAEIDQLPPPAPKSIPVKTSQPLPPPVPQDGPMYSDPWKPNTMMMVIALFPIAALPALSLNWRRLGKPLWALPSFVMGVLIGLCTISSLAIFGPTSVFATGAILFFAFLVGQYALQALEYRKYLQVGDVGGIARYPNDLNWLVGGVIGLIVGLLLAFVFSTLIFGRHT